MVKDGLTTCSDYKIIVITCVISILHLILTELVFNWNKTDLIRFVNTFLNGSQIKVCEIWIIRLQCWKTFIIFNTRHTIVFSSLVENDMQQQKTFQDHASPDLFCIVAIIFYTIEAF